MAAVFAALTAVGGLFAIPLPFSPVPVTLQVLFALLAGILLGPTVGALSQVVYVLLGAAGLPVFAGGAGGLGTLVGPTGGYLTGFVVAAWLVGTISQRGRRSFGVKMVALFGGILGIYVCGVAQLMAVTGMSLTKAVAAGVLPFIGMDVAKAIGAGFIAQAVEARRWPAAGYQRS